MNSKMDALVERARQTGGAVVSLISPDNKTIKAVNTAMEQGIVTRAILVGDQKHIESLENLSGGCRECYDIIDTPKPEDACRTAISLVKDNRVHMMMKGEVNTAVFLKSVLDKKNGLPSNRRLSLVCIFELPGLDRLVILTDPGINPHLFPENKPDSGLDIIYNAIDVARSIGILTPKVALIGANEVPSPALPSSILARQLAQRDWDRAEVSGPLSYDIALYPQYAQKKGMTHDPVAGHADILITPDIVSGNVCYKSWMTTLGGVVANVVPGVRVPLIISSRSDTDRSKFLTICSTVIFSRYTMQKTQNGHHD